MNKGYFGHFVNATFYFLKVRGPRLKDSVDVSALKPCTLTLVEGMKRCRFDESSIFIFFLYFSHPILLPSSDRGLQRGACGGARPATPRRRRLYYVFCIFAVGEGSEWR